MRAVPTWLAASVAAALSVVVTGQSPEPPLIPYVASVKVNASGDQASFTRRLPGGTFLASNIKLHDMIVFAHGLQSFEVEGGPDWIRDVRFDVTIKAETNVGPVAIGPTQIGLQLARDVLAKRFSFQAHRETRERPVFALVRSREDGALGPRIKRSGTDCAAIAAEAGKSGAPWPPRSAEGRVLCGLQTQGNTLTAGGYPMSEFQRYLTGQTQRAVIDRTGLAGAWDFELTFAPPDVAADASADRNIPTLFTALQEQLGLKLDSTRGPAEVLVIDRIERPHTGLAPMRNDGTGSVYASVFFRLTTSAKATVVRRSFMRRRKAEATDVLAALGASVPRCVVPACYDRLSAH